MTSQLQLWSTAVDNHKDHIVRHYHYLHVASKKVKDLHDSSKDRFDKVVHDVRNKFKEMEDKLNAAHDFPAMVANEVQKHHAAFSLVGSEVACVHQELNTVKGAVDQVAQAVVQWESCYSAAAPLNVDTSGQNTSDHAAQVNPNQVFSPGALDSRSQANPLVTGGHAVQPGALDSRSQASPAVVASGSPSQAGVQGAMGPSVCDPWRAAAATATAPPQPWL